MTNIILAAQAQGSDGGYSMLLMMVAIFAIMYFFMIRPQQKKRKEILNFQNSLTEGAKVVTAGGVYGTVKRVNIENATLDLEIAKGVVITVEKSFVYADVASQQAR
ncbi:MAG: preprotein translocase subunit YajC [Prevotella sp.]|nr:preprotein translocase subunit YajC [Prevotella sp.]